MRRCSAFRGGWTLEAIEGICADEFPASNVLETLAALAEKSLVVIDADGELRRYRLLESTRQFLTARLDESGERANVEARHGRYFAQVAQLANDAYWQMDSDAWTALTRRELENHRAAVAWGFAPGGDPSSGALIVSSLRWLWYTTSRREGHDLLARTQEAAAR